MISQLCRQASKEDVPFSRSQSNISVLRVCIYLCICCCFIIKKNQIVYKNIGICSLLDNLHRLKWVGIPINIWMHRTFYPFAGNRHSGLYKLHCRLFRVYSQRVKLNAKAKIFFALWIFFLWSLPIVLWSFRVRFRSMSTGLYMYRYRVRVSQICIVRMPIQVGNG